MDCFGRLGALRHEGGYVFCNAIGEHLSPHAVYHNFKRIAASIGVPAARLHDLQHSYAALSLQIGDDIKTVQSNLGHHTAAFTLDVYGRITGQMEQAGCVHSELIRVFRSKKGKPGRIPEKEP